jgi:hypothetical protein
MLRILLLPQGSRFGQFAMDNLLTPATRVLVVSVLLGVFAPAGLAVSRSQPPIVGVIKQATEPGCGCAHYFSSKSRKPGGLVFSSVAGTPTALMNIDGKDVKLQKVSESRYSNGSIAATLNLKVTKTGYESTEYVGIIKVRHLGKTKVVKVVGWCGC